MTYLEFKDDSYTRLRKDLLKVKGGTLQRELLEATRNSTTFITWIEARRIGLESDGKAIAFDLWVNKLSAFEYKEPPKTVEKELFEKWAALTPAQASRETFWGYVTFEHIRQDIIQAPYLAANGGNLPGGLERIDKALADGQETAIDSTVRTILRRLSGLPEARGAKSVYVNCPFARAWWRGYVAQEVCETTGADFDKVVKTLTISQDYWEKLIVLIVSRNSVMGDTKVRTALIWALSDEVDNEKKSALFLGKTLQKISRQIGIRSAWQELGIFTVYELKHIMEQDFFAQVA